MFTLPFLGLSRPVTPTGEPSRLGLAALEVALSELGNGEEGGNNIGKDIDRYHMGLGKSGDSWCSWFVSFCIYVGWDTLEQAGTPRPWPRIKPSSSARRLFARCVAAGQRLDRPEPGAIVLWARPPNPWSGHIGIVSKVDVGTYHTVEGNRGKVLSKVREYLHEQDEPCLGYARLP